MPNNKSVAVLSVDPGATTGCAAGLFDLRLGTVAGTMRRARSKRLLRSWTIRGDHVEQAWELGRWVEEWEFSTHIEKAAVRSDRYYVTMENFIPRQLNFDPISLQIIGGFETLAKPLFEKTGIHYARQEPGERWCDDGWLKRNRLWVPSDHERDAIRHVATKLDKLLHGNY